MNIKIRTGNKSDIDIYTKLVQRTCQNNYLYEPIGLTKKCFSKEVFNTDDSQKYLLSRLDGVNKKTHLAFIGEKLVGAITLINREKDYELTSFYVDPKYQGRGIGKKLFTLISKGSKDKDITLDTYTHNTKTIDMYKKWGFEIDSERGTFTRHWPEWPGNVEVQCLYMRLKANPSKS